MTEVNKEEEEIELYGEPGIASYNKPVPNWLILTYLTLPVWGIVTFFIFFNGSLGWFDRGSWHALQTAANTNFPIHNANLEELQPILRERVPVIQEGAQKMAEVLQGHKLELQEERVNREVAEGG